jgi:uncharacterized protein YeaO (DUF488 family)
MLKQASVSDLIMERVTREMGHVVITMRRYPRFINRRLRDEYLTCMSPEKELFEAWLTAKRKYEDHDGAFQKSKFEERFWINEEGFEHLARLCALAAEKDVYLVCQCANGMRCHREFVLILAKILFRADVEKPKNDYPIFTARVKKFKATNHRRAQARLKNKMKTELRSSLKKKTA